MLPKLSVVEMGVGLLIQLPFYYLIGDWAFMLAIISSFLWAVGGAEDSSKLVRRLGVPLVSCAFIAQFYMAFWQLLIIYPLAVLIVSMGYGEKSRLWGSIYKATKNHRFSDYSARMIIYVLYWLTFGLLIKY